MPTAIEQFLTTLRREKGDRTNIAAEPDDTLAHWKKAADQEVCELADAILSGLPAEINGDTLDSQLLEDLFVNLGQRYYQGKTTSESSAEPLQHKTLESLANLYERLGPENVARYQVLRILASAADSHALSLFADKIVADPPGENRQIDAACAPLFQVEQLDVDVLFPKLFEALDRPVLAAIVLDLANHLFRTKRLDVHPAAARVQSLTGLLKAMAERLRLVEEQPGKYANSQQELQNLIGECASVIVALCDALGSIGDAAAIPALNTVLELTHRRLRAEAATALARLEEQRGFDTLVELAADPAARTRALAYLEELKRLDAVPEEFRTPKARAEAELSSWLAEPQQIGLAPQSIEVVDQRRQYWPGFDEPQDCYLVRYEYPFPKGTLIGIGLVGPTTYCLAVDLQDLAPSDIYAIYAGWHAEHPELVEEDVSRLSNAERERFEMAGQRIDDERVELAMVGRFFGQDLPVYRANRSQQPGFLVVDGETMSWYGAGTTSRPLGPIEAYWIHKGRRLLASFNSDDADVPEADGSSNT